MNFQIETTLPDLAQVYKGLVAKQNMIYHAICLKGEMMEKAQFEKDSNIIIQSQSFFC